MNNNSFNNPAYGGCTCECHDEDSGCDIIHCMPCCYPGDEDNNTESLFSSTQSRIAIIKHANDSVRISNELTANAIIQPENINQLVQNIKQRLQLLPTENFDNLDNGTFIELFNLTEELNSYIILKQNTLIK